VEALKDLPNSKEDSLGSLPFMSPDVFLDHAKMKYPQEKSLSG
jgi:hypothetical protein